MRNTIETAPRNGNVVILKDARGIYDVAHWSPGAGEWIRRNGEPSKISPSHWYPLPPVDNHLQQELDSFFPFSLREDAPQPTASEVVTSCSAAPVEAQTAPEARRPSRARRGFAISWIVVTLVTAALVGIYFHAEVVAYVARHASQQELITMVPQAQPTPLPRGDEAAQLKQAATESATAELRQSLQQEHDRAEALATELAKARRDVETQAALSSKKGDEAAQLKAAESAAAELLQSLQQEHYRAEVLATELAKARRDVETQVALSSKKGDEAAQLKAAESATAELRQSLQQEHDRAEALATELAKARRDVEQKPAVVEARPDVSLPAWANSDAFVEPAQTAKQPDAAPKNSSKPGETVPLPKPRARAVSQDDGHGCQHYRTYDSASATYTGYDGRRRSCP